MRKKILTAAAILTFAAATSSAMASGHKAGHGHAHVRTLHAGGIHGYMSRHRAGIAGGHRSAGWRDSNSNVSGGFIDLGPLGITAACGSYRRKHGYCGQGYSVSGWSY